MTKIRNDVNKYGTAISVHLCPSCGSEFTVCPAAGENWGGCLAVSCESYDESRDADIMFFFGLVKRDGDG